MEVEAIKCPACLDVIWSRHRHDMRWCKCEKCFIDGGRSYTRFSWGTPEKPELLTIEVEQIAKD